jgi:predicted amidohydrolase
MRPPAPEPNPLRPVRVCVAQLPGAPAPLPARIAAADAALAATPEAELLLLPEATFPGYSPGADPHEAAAQCAAGEAWAEAAARARGLHVGIGLGAPAESALLLIAPDGERWRYTKAWPTFAEAKAWRPGPGPLVAHTRLGPIGLALCADLVQPGLWAGLRGRVSLVLAAGAWADYRGRAATLPWWRAAALGPWMRGAGAHRDRTLAAGARALGAPVAWANACGPWQGAESFAGGSVIVGPDGAPLAAVAGPGAGVACAELWLRPPGPGAPTPFPLVWRAFSLTHRLAARARSAAARRG